MFPSAVRAFAEGVKAGHDVTGSDERRKFMRYLAKAKTLATNAGAGTFPGKWQHIPLAQAAVRRMN